MATRFHGVPALHLRDLARAWAKEAELEERFLGTQMLQAALNAEFDDVNATAAVGERTGLRITLIVDIDAEGGNSRNGRFGFITGRELLGHWQGGSSGLRELIIANLILTREAALAFAASRQLPPPSWWQLPMVTTPTTPRQGNRTGPKPVKRQDIAQRMVGDYRGRADGLEAEKIIVLTQQYNCAKSTAADARKLALAELRNNCGKTPDTGK